jgi:hypothetical protein
MSVPIRLHVHAGVAQVPEWSEGIPSDFVSKAVFFKILLGATVDVNTVDDGVSISSMSFLAFLVACCSSYVARLGCPTGYKEDGIMTVRGCRGPLDRMFGVPIERDRGMSERASILWSASSTAISAQDSELSSCQTNLS